MARTIARTGRVGNREDRGGHPRRALPADDRVSQIEVAPGRALAIGVGMLWRMPERQPSDDPGEGHRRGPFGAFADLLFPESDRDPDGAGTDQDAAGSGPAGSGPAGFGSQGSRTAGGVFPSPSALRGALLSWAPAGLAPALAAFAAFPDQLAWTGQISRRVSDLASPLYDEVTGIEGYGEALEVGLLDLRGLPGRILDVGTGTGFAARRLKRQYPDAEVVGIDISPHMVGIARRNAAAEDRAITFETGNAAHLEAEDASFDLVVCHNAPPYCNELMRVLRPRGKALVIYSFGGPWVELAWKALSGRLEAAGASHARGRRAGFGFFGLARKRG
ncbi:MAG TPA: class I SAM-dependent methyltransferase [Actinomycetota bacterium]|nr:class I SAM-dependent methyltransferase [Actinomycetota bacterium]